MNYGLAYGLPPPRDTGQGIKPTFSESRHHYPFRSPAMFLTS